MSILKVNNIELATSGSNNVTFNDNVTFDAAVNISSGSITASFSIANASIEKEKLTNDARDWVNILNKPAGLVTSSAQFATAISGSSLALADITSSGTIKTTGVFSGSGAQLFGLPNAALNNSTITINGSAVSLGGSRTLTTSDISEGTNQYYTDARVKAKMDTETVVSSSGQINYQSVTGKPTVNTLGSDGNKSFTISTGIFVTASGGADGIIVTNDTANYTLRFRTVGGTVSSSAQVAESLPANVVSSSTQVQPFLPNGTVSASSQYPGWVTASSQIDYNSITNKLSGTVSSSAQVQPLLPANTVSASAQVKVFLPDGTVSASAQYPGWITSSTQVVQSLPVGTVSASAQYPGWVTASSQIDVRNTVGIATIATTGSNTFNGNQTISGSVSITGNLNVFGTSSVLYTTSSQLNVGTNKITIGTDQALRFGGLTVIDSGSSTLSGSLYWDSLNNKWIYENVSGSSGYNSAILIAGPKNVGGLGNESGLATGRVPVATGDDHIDSSAASSSIRIDFTTRRTDIEAGLYITGSTTASGHILPATTDIYDLGSPTLKFRSLYLSGSTLYLGTLALSDNGGALSVSPSGAAAGTNSPVSGAFTGSFKGNGNQLTNIANSALPGGIISSSTQLPAGTVSSSAQYPGWVTASSQVDYNSITNKLSGVYSSSTQVANNLPAGTVSSSGQINAGATSNFATAVAAQLGTVHSGSFMSTATTNNLPEGVTNLYYTDARVKSKLSAEVVHSGSFLGTATTDNLTQGATNKYFANSLVLDYINSLSVLSSSQQVVDRLPTGTVSSSNQIANVQVTSASYALTASLAIGVSGSLAVSTDGLNEGTINLYYTDARVKTKLNAENVHSSSYLGTATTTNLTEGINLYFTNQRVKDALPGVVSSSTQVSALVPAGTVSSSGQVNVRNTTGIATIATTGSNLFIGSQSIVGEYLSSAPTTSSIPNLRLSNGNAVSTWFGGNGYTYNWMQAIQDDGTNNLKNFVLQPLGGSVGVGTYPSFAFEVLGNATRLLGTSASAANVILQSDQGNGAAFWISAKTNSVLHIGGNGPTEPTLGAITILDSGLIGIGTASPTNLLHISGGNIFVDNTNGSVVVRNADATNQQQIRLRMSSTDGVLDVTRNSGTAPNLIFGTEGAEKMRLDANGWLGIGTTSNFDSAKLDVRSGKIVAGTSASTDGSVTIQNYYTNGALSLWGSMYSSGGPLMGYGVKSSITTANSFLSATGISISRGAYIIEGNIHRWYNGANQSVAIDSPVTMTERMIMDANGNVGIGTTNPTGKLHVQGASLYLSTTDDWAPSTGSGLVIARGAATGNTYSSIYGVQSGGGSYANLVVPGGNVGIGTTSPDAKLDVRGSVYTTNTYWGYPTQLVGNLGRGGSGLADLQIVQAGGAFRVINSAYNSSLFVVNDIGTFYSSGSAIIANSVGTGDAHLDIGQGRNANGYAYVDLVGDTTYTDYGTRLIRNNTGANASSFLSHRGTGELGIFTQEAAPITFHTSATEKVRIDSSGNVGIGTTSPGAKLQVVGEINSSGSSSIITVSDRSTSGTGGFYRQSGVNRLWDGAAGDVITWNSSGNVGIGTSGPAQKLHVEGNINLPQGSYITWANGDSQISSISGYHLVFSTYNGSSMTEKVRIESGGNVGIGTSSPAAKLDVSGSIFPNVDNSFNLGSPTKRWANVYTGDLVLSNEGSSGNNVDGTTGNWTIQEGEEHLYIINNKSGKKYRFMLTEIN